MGCPPDFALAPAVPQGWKGGPDSKIGDFLDNEIDKLVESDLMESFKSGKAGPDVLEALSGAAAKFTENLDKQLGPDFVKEGEKEEGEEKPMKPDDHPEVKKLKGSLKPDGSFDVRGARDCK